jgi:hypothetical protein
VPACPSGKGRISVDEKFGGGEDKMKSGVRREVDPGLSAFEYNFECCYKFGGGRWNFDVDMCG